MRDTLVERQRQVEEETSKKETVRRTRKNLPHRRRDNGKRRKQAVHVIPHETHKIY